MKFNVIVLLLTCLIISGAAQNTGWKKLLNEKDLSGWDTYLGPSYDTIRKKWNNAPRGLNNDPMQVFSLITNDGQVLRISGERFGGISTKENFRNYHLRLEFKWGQSKYHPRKNSKRDSGLMYHAV